MTQEQKIGETFHSLSAGMTTIMPDGKVITFGGAIKKGEGFTSVGQGTYTTTDEAEKSWLNSLCEMKQPQVWKEVAQDDVTQVPAEVNAGVVQDQVKVVSELVDKAATSTIADAKSGGARGSDAAAAAADLLQSHVA